MKVSILFMTMDRPEYTKKTLETNMRNHGLDPKEVELLWCDNGSREGQIFDLQRQYKPVYVRNNRTNEGCAKGFNQLILRASGRYLVLMGNDVLMPQDWLKEMIKYAEFVPKCGLVGIKCTAQIPELQFKFGCYGHFLDDKCDKVFGVTLIPRYIVEDIGGFCEDFGPYGLEDSNLNDRVNMRGYNSLYVPCAHFVSTHIGSDVGLGNEYRKMKDQSMAKNLEVFWKYREQYKNGTRPIREELPPMRDPL